eukprot:225965-Prymnesium_polylepis.2
MRLAPGSCTDNALSVPSITELPCAGSRPCRAVTPTQPTDSEARECVVCTCMGLNARSPWTEWLRPVAAIQDEQRHARFSDAVGSSERGAQLLRKLLGLRGVLCVIVDGLEGVRQRTQPRARIDDHFIVGATLVLVQHQHLVEVRWPAPRVGGGGGQRGD